ncbi:MAG: ABC transporter ATP-binding protein [Chloroflexota bacterium]
MSDIILEAIDLRKNFGGLVAVDGVSLKVERGTVHSIIGPNGAGKTTFFNLLSGRYSASAGRVIFKGEDITALATHERALKGIGRSFQITNVFPNLTVLENVRLAAQANSDVNFRFFQRAENYTQFVERAIEVIELVGLHNDMYTLATVLPHGGKRKLELAIIIASDPELLLLDEPTAGMASEQVPELLETIERIREQGNKTVILVEHNMSVVMGVSDKITVMNLGKLLSEGTPQEIAQDDIVQKVYLGELYADEMQGANNG